MIIYAFLIIFVVGQPTGNGSKKFCTATCTGEIENWENYLSNGITTTGDVWLRSDLKNDNLFKLI